MTEAIARSLVLAANSVCFGALWGMMVAPRGGSLGGAIAGALVGVVSAPVPVLALRRRTIGAARWTWLGSTTLVAMAMGLAGASPALGFLATGGTHIGSCLLARVVFPELVEPVPGRCVSCGYDLSGLRDRCPECGAIQDR